MFALGAAGLLSLDRPRVEGRGALEVRCLERGDSACKTAEAKKLDTMRKARKEYNEQLQARNGDQLGRPQAEGAPSVHDPLVPRFGLPAPPQLARLPPGYVISYGRLVRVPGGSSAPAPEGHVLDGGRGEAPPPREAPRKQTERERAELVHKVQQVTPGLDVPPKWWLEPPVWMRSTPWWLKRLGAEKKNEVKEPAAAASLERAAPRGEGEVHARRERRAVDSIPSVEFVEAREPSPRAVRAAPAPGADGRVGGLQRS